MSTNADNSSSNRIAVVADDDATTRLLIRAALEEDGWTVEEAADGAVACEVWVLQRRARLVPRKAVDWRTAVPEHMIKKGLID